MKHHHKFVVLIAAAALSPVGLLFSRTVQPPTESPVGKSDVVAGDVRPQPLSFASCIVIGASVSAGAEVSLPGFPPAIVDGHANFADVLGAMTGAVEPVLNLDPSPTVVRLNSGSPMNVASWQFFMQPEKMSEAQLAACARMNPPPRIIFAIDYLFWHAYGAGKSDDQRRSMFDEGLRRLGTLPANTTVVLADLPDMTHAVGLMLSKDMVPSPVLQAELNTKLAAWAAKKEHTNVVMVPLREVVTNAWARQPVTLGGKVYDGDAARGLLTNSGLHATVEGLMGLAAETLDRLKQRGVIGETQTWESDAAIITRRLVEAKTTREAAKKAAIERKSAAKP